MWSRWVESVPGLVNVIQEVAKRHPKTLFLVKPHPLSQEKNIDQKHNVKNAVGFHYKDCLAYCDKVYVLNSGAGMQAMLWGKPTYIFGKSHYLFTRISKSVDNIQQAMDFVSDDFKVDMEKVLRFIYFLKFFFWSDVNLSQGAKKCRYETIRMI
jgi:capsule polysaccharide export protein KpsC/LpsZ